MNNAKAGARPPDESRHGQCGDLCTAEHQFTSLRHLRIGYEADFRGPGRTRSHCRSGDTSRVYNTKLVAMGGTLKKKRPNYRWKLLEVEGRTLPDLRIDPITGVVYGAGPTIAPERRAWNTTWHSMPWVDRLRTASSWVKAHFRPTQSQFKSRNHEWGSEESWNIHRAMTHY